MTPKLFIIALLLAIAGMHTYAMSKAPKATATPQPAAPAVQQQDEQPLWLNNFETAKERATAQGKDILVDFSGSDWCGWCIKLNKEVFDTPAFKTAAPQRFILMEADFPRDESKVPPDIAQQNAALRDAFNVQGYPTILLLDAQGRPYAQTGYRDGGPAAYLAHLEQLQKIREQRDAAWKQAATVAGAAKAALLAEGLGVLDANLAGHYGSVIAEIKTLDPSGTNAIIKKIEYSAALTVLNDTINSAVYERRDCTGLDAQVDDFIAENAPTGEELQSVMMLKLKLYPPTSMVTIATIITLLDDIAAVDPMTDTAHTAQQIKENLEQLMARVEQQQRAAAAADAASADAALAGADGPAASE